MKRSLVVGLFLVLSSCARDQQLVSISIQPGTEDFQIADPTLQVQLRALGNFIHPPVTKDITSQVTWNSNSPQIATVTAGGLLSPGGQVCGNAQITATVDTNSDLSNRTADGAIVTASMTATVDCP